MKKLILLLSMSLTLLMSAQKKEYHTQLVPFEYDSFKLSKTNKQILSSMVYDHMDVEILTIIVGVTDSDKYHKELGEKRVLSIKKHLKNLDITDDRNIIFVKLKLGIKKAIKIYYKDSLNNKD